MSNDRQPSNPEPTQLVPPPTDTSEQNSAPKRNIPKLILLTVLGATLAIAGSFVVVRQSAQRATNQPVAVKVQPLAVSTLMIKPTKVSDTLKFSGSLQPIESAVLSTQAMGRIISLPFKEGDRVEKGQVIARIDVSGFADIDTQDDSTVTQSGKYLESQQLEAKNALNLAQINQERMAQLYQDGAISKAQLEEAKTALGDARARLIQVESGIKQAAAASQKPQAAVVEIEAHSTASSANVNYGTILAPFDGVVAKKLAYEGETTKPGTQLLKLENPSLLQLEVSVPEKDLRFVQPNQPITVSIDALNRTFPSTVKQIVPPADSKARNFLLKVPLPKSSNLVPGMRGRIELTHDTKEAIAIPSSALFKRGQQTGVYVVEANNQAKIRWVKTGSEQQGQVEIVSGLVRGDRIVTSNVQQLSDGQQILIQNVF